MDTTTRPRVAIIGRGSVGSALERGLARTGYETRTSGHDNVREAADWGEVVMLAVPFGARADVVRVAGPAFHGKVVVDVTNALTDDMRLALGPTGSGAEELQRLAPDTRVVKAFNTVFARHMDRGAVAGEQLTVFTAGDDPDARRVVIAIAADLGFDPVDAGPLANARWLETLGYFNIQLGYALGFGVDSGFRFVHPRRDVNEAPIAGETRAA